LIASRSVEIGYDDVERDFVEDIVEGIVAFHVHRVVADIGIAGIHEILGVESLEIAVAGSEYDRRFFSVRLGARVGQQLHKCPLIRFECLQSWHDGEGQSYERQRAADGSHFPLFLLLQICVTKHQKTMHAN
jgi:hypothetical protein